MDAGEEQITDAIIVSRLREKARRINHRALLTAIIATLVALVFPSSLDLP
jgi:hypothetical protein